MAFPDDLEIEVAFNNDIDETDHAQTGWTSILPFVAGFSGDLRGRAYELDRTEAGTLSVRLDNADGRFLPGSVQSPYYPYVKSDRRFRIRGKNMVHPNVARGGSRDRNLTGYTYPLFADSLEVQAFTDPLAIVASAEPNAPSQGKEKLIDGIKNTMWTINTEAGTVYYQYPAAIRMTRYSLTIPAGESDRNPADWTLEGSNNGSSWTTIDTVTGNEWASDYEVQEFTITSPDFYTYYRLNITGNVGSVTNTQLAEFALDYDEASDLPVPNMDLTHFVKVGLDAGKTANWYEMVSWYVPLEYGVRLAHSAYVWKISGTEPAGMKYKVHITYFDDAFEIVGSTEGVADPSEEVVTPTDTSPTQIGFSHTPPSGAKYGSMSLAVYIGSTPNATELVYGITGAQSELPTNLAPDISGYRDTYNWQIETEGETGTVESIATSSGTGAIVEQSSPSFVSGNSTTITTASFTPANNSLLVAMVAAGNGTGGAISLGSVTDSLGGTWTRKVSTTGGFDGLSEIWIRDVVTGAPMTVTWDPGGAVASGLAMKVQVVTGAKPVAQQTGAHATVDGGEPFTVDITTTAPNSRIYGAIGRAETAVALTAISGTAIYDQIQGSAGDVAAAFKSSDAIATVSNVTLGFNNIDTAGQRICVFEILAANQGVSDPDTASLRFVWGVDDVNGYITIPHLIPGETYLATVEAKKTSHTQPDVMFSGDEGETGEMIMSTAWSQYSIRFIAQQPEQELRFILQDVPTAGNGLEVRKLKVERMLDEPMANQHYNPDFETNALGWISGDGSIARSTAQFYSGVASLLLTPNGTGADPRAEATADAYLPVVEGDLVKVSAWVRPTTTNKTIMLGVNWYNSGGSWFDQDSTFHSVKTAGAWQYVTATLAAPTGAADAGIRVGLTGTPAIGDTMYIDDISIAIAPLSLAESAIEAGFTEWNRPKDIFEGWVERWPAIAGSLEMTITVVDRMKRLGDIELENTLREALLQDEPQLLMPLNDSLLDTPGRFSQLGDWAEEEGGPTYVDISFSRGDLAGSTYTTQTDDGPTGEASFRNSPADSSITGKGYLFAIPYSKDFIAPSEPPPPTTAPTKPKPPPPPKYTYTKKWYATWSRSYEGDGSTRFDDSPYMYQGTYSGSPGDQRSLAGFDWRNIMATLAGAEILEAYITLKNRHARWNKGLYVFVGTHNYSTKGSTWVDAQVRQRRWKKWVSEGGSVTINAGTTFGYELRSGATRGIGIGPESNSDNYGFFYGATHSGRPYITVRYRK